MPIPVTTTRRIGLDPFDGEASAARRLVPVNGGLDLIQCSRGLGFRQAGIRHGTPTAWFNRGGIAAHDQCGGLTVAGVIGFEKRRIGERPRPAEDEVKLDGRIGLVTVEDFRQRAAVGGEQATDQLDGTAARRRGCRCNP